MSTTQELIQIDKQAQKMHNTNNNMKQIEEYFGYVNNFSELGNLGLKLQIIKKNSMPNYLHGYILSTCLKEYIDKHNSNDNYTILETGTARGFSSMVMCHVLNENSKNATIHTCDLISNTTKQYNNCYLSKELKQKVSVMECLDEWKELRDKYIKFYIGDSKRSMNNMNVDRIHFAFLDGHHIYSYVNFELNYVKDRQQSGDVILCDDYTRSQMPEICKAVDEFLENNLYNHHIFYCNDGNKKRGYVYMIRK